ncbi:hypothetical protein AMTRI_Chr09g22980 [Amborella trichopoda]
MRGVRGLCIVVLASETCSLAPAAFRLPLASYLDTCRILVTLIWFCWINHSLKLFRMAPMTFVVSLDTSWHFILVVLSLDFRPIIARQLWSILTSDMLVRVYHVDGYGLTCQHVISVLSASLFPTWQLATLKMELTTLALLPNF